jgi:simple sugar transport system substrate-binding protein/basic membrane protein A
VNQRRLVTAFVATSAVLALAACSSATSSTTSASTAPGAGSKAVGFIFVGPKTDFGYNQAAYEGSQEVAKKFPDLKVLTQENVPEDDNAARVMEGMIRKGAKIIFATSYGHKDPALKVAAAHPDVVVLEQGNIADGTMPPNFGTYFGTVYEPVYLAGITHRIERLPARVALQRLDIDPFMHPGVNDAGRRRPRVSDETVTAAFPRR